MYQPLISGFIADALRWFHPSARDGVLLTWSRRSTDLPVIFTARRSISETSLSLKLVDRLGLGHP
jgi:hypothetical protein